MKKWLKFQLLVTKSRIERRQLERHMELETRDQKAWAAARLSGAARTNKSREKQFAPAHGWASLPWIEEPTRAGWWWFRADERKATPLRVINGAWITSDAEMRWLEVVDGYSLTLNQHAEQNPGGWWAGPIEPPQVPDEETTPNDPSSATAD